MIRKGEKNKKNVENIEMKKQGMKNAGVKRTYISSQQQRGQPVVRGRRIWLCARGASGGARRGSEGAPVLCQGTATAAPRCPIRSWSSRSARVPPFAEPSATLAAAGCTPASGCARKPAGSAGCSLQIDIKNTDAYHSRGASSLHI